MFIDIHNHLLPGVDDGIRKIEDTILELKLYKKHGINHVIFTPHINNPSVNTSVEKIRNTYDSLKNLIESETGLITYLASELYLVPNYKEFIPFNDSFVLIEFPTRVYPIYALDAIFNIQLEGYEVILVHVERYRWLFENKKLIQRMKEMNVYFQVNFEGVDTEEGRFYLGNNLVDFLATDNHGKDNRKEVDLSLFSRYSKITTKAFELLGLNTPEKL